MDEFSQRRLDRVMKQLRNLNRTGWTPEEFEIALEDTLCVVRDSCIDFFESQYDIDEPGVATINCSVLLNDLIDVATFKAEAKRD